MAICYYSGVSSSGSPAMAWIRRFSGWRRLMAADGVLGWRDELDVLKQRLGPLFVRPEPRRQAGRYLEALLSGAPRKNGWQLAEQIGDARPWRTQRVLSHVQWDQDAARHLPGRCGRTHWQSRWRAGGR